MTIEGGFVSPDGPETGEHLLSLSVAELKTRMYDLLEERSGEIQYTDHYGLSAVSANRINDINKEIDMVIFSLLEHGHELTEHEKRAVFGGSDDDAAAEAFGI